MSTLARRLAGSLLMVAALVAPAGAATVGEPAVVAAERLSLPGLDGVKHTLAHWQGRAILLSFWATWCEPCIAEIPRLAALEERYRARGLSIVSVGIDEPAKLRNVVRTLDINYPVLVADPDRARPLLDAWGDKSGVIPFLVFIDRHGRVTATHRGPIDPDDLEDLIRPLLVADHVH